MAGDETVSLVSRREVHHQRVGAGRRVIRSHWMREHCTVCVCGRLCDVLHLCWVKFVRCIRFMRLCVKFRCVLISCGVVDSDVCDVEVVWCC